MMRVTGFVSLAVCAVLCTAQPVDKYPVLKQMPFELVFKENRELVVECVTEGKVGGVTYTWMKDGKPYTPTDKVVQRDNEGTLVFKSPIKTDEGTYHCFAESTFGIASSKVTLKRGYIDTPKVTLQRHKPIEGRMYKLDCKIPDSYPRPEVFWMYTSLSDPTATRNVLNRRITLSPEGDLYFSNVTKEDTSMNYKYVCVAKSEAIDSEVVLAEHVLEDALPNDGGEDHELVPQYVSSDFTTTLGSVTMIYCIYGGTPLAFPYWVKDGKNVSNSAGDRVTNRNRTSGKRVLIKDTWLEDQGNYTCFVDNELGAPQHHTMHLTVVSAPQFTKQPEKLAIVKIGQDVTMPCQIAGVPLPKVSRHLRRQRTLVTKEQIEKVQIQRSTHGNITVADLTIKNVQKDDGGYYGCKGVNDYGEVYAETLIVVQ